MDDYTVTVYLAGGAIVKGTLEAATDDGALKKLEDELKDEKFVLNMREEHATLVIRNPGVNVVAYSVDRVRG